VISGVGELGVSSDTDVAVLQLAGGLSPTNFEPSDMVQRTSADVPGATLRTAAKATAWRIGFTFSGGEATPTPR
jgi:hypothetical protein